jgi:hypothetical protein
MRHRNFDRSTACFLLTRGCSDAFGQFLSCWDPRTMPNKHFCVQYCRCVPWLLLACSLLFLPLSFCWLPGFSGYSVNCSHLVWLGHLMCQDHPAHHPGRMPHERGGEAGIIRTRRRPEEEEEEESRKKRDENTII